MKMPPFVNLLLGAVGRTYPGPRCGTQSRRRAPTAACVASQMILPYVYQTEINFSAANRPSERHSIR